MQRALHIDPVKCTGCLQCEMACSYENEGIFNPAKSRIKVFTFHEEGRFAPYTCTQCAEAWCLQACPVDAIQLDADHRRQGGRRVALRRLQGVHHRLSVRHRELQRGQRQGDQVRPVRRRSGLRQGLPDRGDHLRRRRLDRAGQDARVRRRRAWPARPEQGENDHGVDQKNPARRPRQGHLHRRTAQHGMGERVSRPARPGDQVPGRGDRPEVRSAGAGQQADHGHRPADRHHGLDRRALLGDHQEPADRAGRLLELRWLHRRRDEERRLGHDHLRGQVARAGLPVRRGRQGRAARRRRPVGQVGLGDRRDAAQDAPGPAAAHRLYRPGGRGRLPVRGGRQRPAPCRRALRRRHGDGLEEPQGGRRARHPGRGQHRRSEGLHGGGQRRQGRCWPTMRSPARACRPTAPRC